MSKANSPRGKDISRRRFLKGSAATLVTPIVASPASASRLFGQEGEETEVELKVGLVGCGGRGTGAAAQALSANGGKQVLTAVADIFPDRTERCLNNLRAHFGEQAGEYVQVDNSHAFAGFDAYQKLIDSGVDVVLLATPPHFRAAQLEAAIAADKHVFCEKPVAVDGPGIRSVLETVEKAREKNLSLVCGFCWRYNVRHRAFYERLHDGALGDIRAIYSTYNASPLGTAERKPEWSDMEFQLRNWQHMDWLSGDHIVEQAVHSLDKQAWAMQDQPPKSVTAVGGRQARFGEARGNIYDHFSATFEYDNDVKAYHMCRQMPNCSNDNSDFIHGEKGNGFINGWAPLHKFDGENAWVYEGEGNDMYQQEHDELFQSIRNGEGKNDGVWMAHSALLAIMARMAAYTGQTITWDQALNSQELLGPETYEWGDVALNEVPVPGRKRYS